MAHDGGGLMDVFAACRGVRPVLVAAPMVRYSRLPFRLLVREYGADVCYTPMVLADCFVRSARARDVELPLAAADAPLVVQFAARDPVVFGQAAALVAPFVQGVDLNCGCPQGWAAAEGLGAALMRDPQAVREMVRAARNATAGAALPVSVKMRLYAQDAGHARTVDLARSLEAAGVSFLAVHARTPGQKSSHPPNWAALDSVCRAVSIPVIANGDVASLAGAEALWRRLGGACAGAMAARGLLANPALFAGHGRTPPAAVERFLDLATAYGCAAPVVQHHVAQMCAGGVVSPAAHREIASMAAASVPAVVDWWRRSRPSSDDSCPSIE